jgi:peptidoglycan/xylan/chitin deacetylase (PgdA/CDA1 family)
MAGAPWMLRKGRANQLTVLTFHRISNEKDFFFNPIRPADLEQLLTYLMKHYSIIGFKSVNDKTSKPKLILSFDDGYYDFVENALPILVKYNLPCNLNLVNACLNSNGIIWTQVLNDVFNYLKDNSITDDKIIEKYSPGFDHSGRNWMNYYLSFFRALLNTKKTERNSILDELLKEYPARKTYRMMNWNDAALCTRSDVEIGSHSYTHDSLKTLGSYEEIKLEIDQSIAEIQAKLNMKVNIMAFPNGQYNQMVLDVCASNGLNYVLASDNKTTPLTGLKDKTAVVERIHMVGESVPEMILRSELFHARLRSFV